MRKDKIVYNLDDDTVMLDADSFIHVIRNKAGKIRSHVYVVVKYSDSFPDGRINGVYADEHSAYKCKNRLFNKTFDLPSYVSVLKFRIKGY